VDSSTFSTVSNQVNFLLSVHLVDIFAEVGNNLVELSMSGLPASRFLSVLGAETVDFNMKLVTRSLALLVQLNVVVSVLLNASEGLDMGRGGKELVLKRLVLDLPLLERNLEISVGTLVQELVGEVGSRLTHDRGLSGHTGLAHDIFILSF